MNPKILGNRHFCEDYNIRYPYFAGAMFKGISSPKLVIRMGQAGLLGFLGTGGLKLPVIEEAIEAIQSQLANNQPYGMNLLHHFGQPEIEMSHVELFLKKGIKNVEAAAFMQITPALVRYRLTGLKRKSSTTENIINAHNQQQEDIIISNRIIAKVSRPEVAKAFMSPPPERIVRQLVEAKQLTREEATLGESIPMAHDICLEADSGGHTDQGVAYVLIPTIQRLKEELMKQYNYKKPIRVGAAGGIGTPEAAAAAFILGADFIVTGSINQCTVEAAISDEVKTLLQAANIQDTAIAPAGDMFEIGAKVQVLKKGLFFPARANKLYELYKHHNSLDDIDEKTKQQIQDKYFNRTFADVWEETKNYYTKENPQEIEKAENNPKQKMSLIFKWYFIRSSRMARKGDDSERVNYQIHCGPALGAFNQWVKGGPLESWQNRHVDEIAEKIMQGAAQWLTKKMAAWFPNQTKPETNKITHLLHEETN